MLNHLTQPLVPAQPEDFIPIPKTRLEYRGINFSRSSLLRLIDRHKIKDVKFRITGGAKGRTFILRESLDRWIESELSRPENSATTAA